MSNIEELKDDVVTIKGGLQLSSIEPKSHNPKTPIPGNIGIKWTSTRSQDFKISENEIAIMEEINLMARRDFSGQGLNLDDYGELMKLYSNFTLSFKAVWDNRHNSVPLCQKSGDLLEFYIKKRKGLSLDLL